MSSGVANRVLGLALAVLSAVLSIGYTYYTTKRKKVMMQERKRGGNVNIGAIFGMDIGGTLTKIVYFEADMGQRKHDHLSTHHSYYSPSTESSIFREISIEGTTSPTLKRNRSFVNLEQPEQKAALQEFYEYIDMGRELAVRDDKLSFYSDILGGYIHFLHFETRNMMEAINYLSLTAITENIRTIGCTGGGSHKYAQQFADQLQIKVVPLDELGCLVRGMDFTLTNVENECYTYRRLTKQGSVKQQNSQSIGATENAEEAAKPEDSESRKWQTDVKEDMHSVIVPKEMFVSNELFPYLVVNIGSGVSILRITSPGQFERVSGSSVGGGTYWGLCRLLTSCSSYEKVLDLAETGNAAEVDMLVRDIYGGSYDQMNLNGSMVASSFGKLVMKENPREGVKEEDLAIALLMMITNNIGQVAYLNAQLHKCRKIFFVGSFLRHNSISCRRLAFAIDFWSGGKNEALFLKHEGYFGALGTFLQSAFESDVDNILHLGHSPRQVDADTNRESESESSADILSPELRKDSGKMIPGNGLERSRRPRDQRLQALSALNSPSTFGGLNQRHFKRFRSFSNDAKANRVDSDSPPLGGKSISTDHHDSDTGDMRDKGWKDFQAQSLEWNRPRSSLHA